MIEIVIAILAITSPAWMLYLMIKWNQYTERREREKEQYGPKATTH